MTGLGTWEEGFAAFLPVRHRIATGRAVELAVGFEPTT